MSTDVIKICYFPGRESTYSRNRVLTQGLQSTGITVFDCSYPRRSFYRNVISFFKFLKYKRNSDVILVGFMGQFIIPFVRLFTRKKIVFDALISLHQTLAFDRKQICPNGIIAKIAKFFDRYACSLADIVLLDTDQHINYFVNELGIPKEKFKKVLVGSDDSIMYPRSKKTEEFIVHFHGEFQELHGVETIVEAAKLLPDIKFRMIGKGKLLPICKDIAKKENIANIDFIDPVPYEKLPEFIAEASICLGIFGNTQKTQMVIPHKVYEALAMQKPVITANTPAANELLVHKVNAVLCKTTAPKDLAKSIKELEENEELRNTIAKNGYSIFQEKCFPGIIGKEIREIAGNLLI